MEEILSGALLGCVVCEVQDELDRWLMRVQDDLRVAGEDPRNGQLLLLSPAHGSGKLRQAFPQNWEEGKLYYNWTITAASVAVAILVGSLETLNLVGGQLGLSNSGGFLGIVGLLNKNFGGLGAVIIGIFIVAWLASYINYRFRRYDDIVITVA